MYVSQVERPSSVPNGLLDSRSFRLLRGAESFSIKGEVIRAKKQNGCNMKCRSDFCRYDNCLTMHENMSKAPLRLAKGKGTTKWGARIHVT